MNYIIGDIHANITELKKLFEIIDPKKGDSFIFLGDYIDKNPYLDETLDFLFDLDRYYNCIFIKGNHEFVWERYLVYGELGRKDFIEKHGQHTLKKIGKDLKKLKEKLALFLKFVEKNVDYHIVGKYVAVHAGLLPEQLTHNPVKFIELNYFLRVDNMDTDKLYLDKYRVVAGHTFLGVEPLIKNSYINIDLGAGYGKYIAALRVEDDIIIRSDGEVFKA
ncbi:MAG: metallophosphoesterase [Candidatus Paceibacterota bacterium]|jgi:serine/threonine protein phosphatase 1